MIDSRKSMLVVFVATGVVSLLAAFSVDKGGDGYSASRPSGHPNLAATASAAMTGGSSDALADGGIATQGDAPAVGGGRSDRVYPPRIDIGQAASLTGGACLTDADCDDGDPCTIDVCDLFTGTCFSFPGLDSDGDGLADICDNCPFAFNPGQEDGDLDGIGDACDLGDPLPSGCETLAIGGLPGWTVNTPPPVGIEGAAGVIIGDRIYVTHAYTSFGGDSAFNQIYDIPTDTWGSGASGTVVRSELTGVCIEDDTGQGLVFAVGGRVGGPGGGPTGALEIYNPVTNTWTPGPPLPTPRRGLGAAFVPGPGIAGGGLGTVFVFGGSDGAIPHSGTPLGVVEAYDVALGWVVGLAPMPIPMMDIYSTTYFPGTGLIYVIGGFDGAAVSSAVQIYDPTGDSWFFGSPMPTPRSNLISGICGTAIYAIGGYDGFTNLMVNESYSPYTDTWFTPEPPKPTASSEMASQAIFTGADIYAIGEGIFGTAGPINEVFTCGTPPPCFSDADCDDGGPCTIDVCDVVTGTCFSFPGPDSDGDGLADICDNCPTVPNASQEDADADSVGDACDNCPTFYNPGQGPLIFGQDVVGRGYCSGDATLSCVLDSDCPAGTCIKAAYGWPVSVDFSYVVGSFVTASDIGTYTFFFAAAGTGSFITDPGTPAADSGFWYLFKPDCSAGSWQSTLGAEPARDAALP